MCYILVHILWCLEDNMEETLKTKEEKIKFFDRTIVVCIVAYLMILVGQVIGAMIYVVLGRLGDTITPGFSSSAVWQTLFSYVLFVGIWMLALGCLAVSRSGRTIIKSLWSGLKGNTVKMLLVGLAIGLGMNLVCAFIAILNGDIALYYDSFKPGSFVIIFVFVFIQSAAEEFICRGYMYQKFMKRYGKPVVAAVINAAFFTLVHLVNPGVTALAIVNIFIYGLLFSAMVRYFDSIWVAMAAHAAWNFCQNIILGLPNSGIVSPYSVFKLDASTAADSFAYSVSFGIESTITASIMLLAVTALIVWRGEKKGVGYTDIWNKAAAET